MTTGPDYPARPYAHFTTQRLEASEQEVKEARVRIIRIANGGHGGLGEALDRLVAAVREDERLRHADYLPTLALAAKGKSALRAVILGALGRGTAS